MKRITKEPWFIKHKATWGLRPSSWQGWFISFLFVVIIVGLMLLTYINPQDVLVIEGVVILVVLTFLITMLVSSDDTVRKKKAK